MIKYLSISFGLNIENRYPLIVRPIFYFTVSIIIYLSQHVAGYVSIGTPIRFNSYSSPKLYTVIRIKYRGRG